MSRSFTSATGARSRANGAPANVTSEGRHGSDRERKQSPPAHQMVDVVADPVNALTPSSSQTLSHYTRGEAGYRTRADTLLTQQQQQQRHRHPHAHTRLPHAHERTQVADAQPTTLHGDVSPASAEYASAALSGASLSSSGSLVGGGRPAQDGDQRHADTTSAGAPASSPSFASSSPASTSSSSSPVQSRSGSRHSTLGSGSADYHSVSSPVVPTGSANDLPAMMTEGSGSVLPATAITAHRVPFTAEEHTQASYESSQRDALPQAASAVPPAPTPSGQRSSSRNSAAAGVDALLGNSPPASAQPLLASRQQEQAGASTLPGLHTWGGGGGAAGEGGVAGDGRWRGSDGGQRNAQQQQRSGDGSGGGRGSSGAPCDAPYGAAGRRFYYQPFQDSEPVCAATTASAAEWVLLNVGGRLITTTIGTLMSDPDSMLAALCTCLMRAQLSPQPSLIPLQQQPTSSSSAGSAAPLRRGTVESSNSGGVGAAAVHRDPNAAAAPAVSAATVVRSTAMEAVAGAFASHSRSHSLRRNAERDGDDVVGAPTSGDGGDAQPLEESYGDGAVGGGLSRGSIEETDAEAAGGDDGDRSSPSADLHAAAAAAHPHHTHRRSAPTSQTQSALPTPSPAVSAAAADNTASIAAAAALAADKGDGEAVSPQQVTSAIPLDTDNYNAILLDLDADYFLPVLNYLRHGAVMIPQYLHVSGVLAMAEYLNVSGLVRLLRGPPTPHRVLLFSWGSGSNGELGTHAVRDEPTPTMAQVTPFGERVREIALGANYSCALTDSGHVYTVGNGDWGQLGLGGSGGPGDGRGINGGGVGEHGSGSSPDGNGTDVPVELLIPRRIPLFERVPAVHVAAGYAFAMAVVEGHHVYFWGNNNHGQSGRGRSFFDPHTKKVHAPVLVETLEGKRIVQLSCGSFFALALSEDGALYSWGLVDCIGLGTPEEVERRYHDVLGESLSNERRSVVLTPQLVTVKGRRRTAASAGVPIAPERIVRIRAGQWHSGAINEHGELFTWGVGYQGRLGHGSKTPAYVPTLVQGALEGQRVVDVACGSFHTVALTARGDVFCWGDNASGQCGTTAGSPDAFTAPYRVVGLEYVAGGTARSIACGRQHTVVVMEGPQPWCTLPCCQVTAAGQAGHSHAQVYCFGEVTPTSNASGGNSAAAAAAAASGVSGPTRGGAAGSHGLPVAGLGANSALPGTPNHGPFGIAGGATTAFLPSPASGGSGFSTRAALAGTAGHHHPHYQLVTGLQMVDVQAVVSGLHHTFAYVEELCGEPVNTTRGSDYYGAPAWQYSHQQHTQPPFFASPPPPQNAYSDRLAAAWMPSAPPQHHPHLRGSPAPWAVSSSAYAQLPLPQQPATTVSRADVYHPEQDWTSEWSAVRGLRGGGGRAAAAAEPSSPFGLGAYESRTGARPMPQWPGGAQQRAPVGSSSSSAAAAAVGGATAPLRGRPSTVGHDARSAAREGRAADL